MNLILSLALADNTSRAVAIGLINKGGFPMGKTEALAEVFLTAFRSLPKAERETVLRGLVKDKNLRRDLMDLSIIEERRKEPSRPFREYLKERQGRR